MIIHIECTDQEFGECHFFKKLICIICSVVLVIQVLLVINDFKSTILFLWGKIYFGSFLCLYFSLLKKSMCFNILV